jgi:hypothetical protein
MAQQEEKQARVVVFVSSSRNHSRHRRAIRQTWMRFAHPPSEDAAESTALPAEDRARLTVRFVVSRKGAATDQNDDADAALDAALDAEHAQHNDLFFASTPEGYDRLWAKALEFLRVQLQQDSNQKSIAYFFHADDDSYVRLDLLVREVLFGPAASPPAPAPRSRFYWGYAWNAPQQNPGATASPIRDPRNKSHMPEGDYPFESYPPFCSGCGFALSRDLAASLVEGLASGRVRGQYRVLDPPFGVFLCGPPPPEGRGLFGSGAQVTPVHDGRVRPYRALPLFDARTIVQHYLRPEEMGPFHTRVLATLEGKEEEEEEEEGGGAAAGLYNQLVGMGLLRR